MHFSSTSPAPAHCKSYEHESSVLYLEEFGITYNGRRTADADARLLHVLRLPRRRVARPGWQVEEKFEFRAALHYRQALIVRNEHHRTALKAPLRRVVDARVREAREVLEVVVAAFVRLLLLRAVRGDGHARSVHR